MVLITHKLREIMAATDAVSVMRQGEMVAISRTAETSVEALAEAMVGRRVLLRVEKGPARPARSSSRSRRPRGRRPGVERLRGVSFDVRAGEIVGIAGVSRQRPVRTARIRSPASAADLGAIMLTASRSM
jgi:ABC-type uncharacterized transport system ATPase subunit